MKSGILCLLFYVALNVKICTIHVGSRNLITESGPHTENEKHNTFQRALARLWLMWCRAYVLQQLLFLANIIINFPNPKPRCESYNNTEWRYVYIKGYNFSFITTRLCILNISWAERVLAWMPVLTGQTRCKIWKSTKILQIFSV